VLKIFPLQLLTINAEMKKQNKDKSYCKYNNNTKKTTVTTIALSSWWW